MTVSGLTRQPSPLSRSDVATADLGRYPAPQPGEQMMAPLTCEVFRDFSGLDRLRPQWDDAVLRTSGSVYMTYDWVRIWWQFYGQRSELRLFVFSNGERIEALVPIYVDTLGWGPLRLRVARLVGANIPPKVFNPPVPEGHASEVLTEVLTHLFIRDKCDVVSLGPVSELEQWKECVQAVCTQGGGLVGRCEVGEGVHTIFHLPADMEKYYSGLSKNERKNRRKYDLRLLTKEYETQVEVVSEPSRILEEFERFAEQHRLQWFAEGKTGHFGAWPRALEFNRALVEAQGKRGRVRFIRILANGQIVANQYAFAFGDRYYWELPSRAVEPKWERFSLGPTGIVTMLAQGIAEGMTRVEGGLAHYDYKLRLGAREYSAPTFRIVASRSSSLARFAVFSLARRCVNLAYHKLWYRRIAPRFPRPLWRPQWTLWLRLDF